MVKNIWSKILDVVTKNPDLLEVESYFLYIPELQDENGSMGVETIRTITPDFLYKEGNRACAFGIAYLIAKSEGMDLEDFSFSDAFAEKIFGERIGSYDEEESLKYIIFAMKTPQVLEQIQKRAEQENVLPM